MPYLGTPIIGDGKPSLAPVIKTPPKQTDTSSRSEGWSPTAEDKPLAPKTDTAALIAAQSDQEYRGHTLSPMVQNGQVMGWAILGEVKGMPMGMHIPLMTFPAGTTVDSLKAWVDRRIDAPASSTMAAPKSTATAKQAALPAADSKGLPVETAPTTTPGTTAPGASKMTTGTKVALGAGAGLLALFALKG